MGKKIISIMLVLMLVLSLSACGKKAEAPAGQSAEKPQQVYVLKHAHVLSPQEPFHAGFLKWAEAVKKRTNGGLIIEVYPGSQLGVEEDLLEQAKQGVNVGQTPTLPDLACMSKKSL